MSKKEIKVPLSGFTPKHDWVYSGPRPKFGGNLFSSFCVILLTNQSNKLTWVKTLMTEVSFLSELFL